jgi:hypothetical protein
MFPVTPKLPVAPVPVVTIFCEPKLGDTLVPAMAADALMSALTIVLFSILVLLTAPSFISVVLIIWDCAS